MQRSATDVMQDVIAAAVLDAIAALKAGSGGLPNNLLRDINAIHANTTFADLPKDVQTAVTASVRAAFARLLKEGYSVSASTPGQTRSAPPPHHRDRPPRRSSEGRGPPNRPGGGDRRPPGGGGRPNRGGKPGGGKPGGGKPSGGNRGS